LTKWRWKLLDDGHSLWKEVIRSKYGGEVIGRVDWSDEGKPWFSSLWWKDISSIGYNLDTNLLAQNVKKCLGNGVNTSFWWDNWVGSAPLKDRFPRLFSIASQKEAKVADVWGGSVLGQWNFHWRRRLFVWEETLLEELVEVLQPVMLTAEEDKWRWSIDSNGGFSVNSTYAFVSDLLAEQVNITKEQIAAFKGIWKCTVPSKAQGFAWLVLNDRIPTKANLFRYKILLQPSDRTCLLCGVEEENSIHLLVYCPFARQMWATICQWLNLTFCLPQSCISLLNYFAEVQNDKKLRQGMVSIWCTAIWALWRHRNRIAFENGTADLLEVVDEIKFTSWKWWIAKSNKPPCLLYEWLQEPRLCIMRS
jgi:hypothetical protein